GGAGDAADQFPCPRLSGGQAAEKPLSDARYGGSSPSQATDRTCGEEGPRAGRIDGGEGDECSDPRQLISGCTHAKTSPHYHGLAGAPNATYHGFPTSAKETADGPIARRLCPWPAPSGPRQLAAKARRGPARC